MPHPFADAQKYERVVTFRGTLANRPATPPDKAVKYVATDTGQVFVSDDTMEWVEVGSGGAAGKLYLHHNYHREDA